MKAILIVLDSVGIGAAPDASHYDDEGSATIPHIATACGGLNLPTMKSMGLGNIPGLLPGGIPIEGVSPVDGPIASFGAMQEVSEGKDTITGHWEIAGLHISPGFGLFPPGPPSFPEEIIREFEERTGHKVIGNSAASGTAVIEELGEQAIKESAWIVYTSADSVFQIAAHVGVIPLDQLYKACEIARELCDPLRVGRVIARPFTGGPGHFERTEDRRDYAFKPTEKTILERLHDAGVPVFCVGKIEDIYAHRGITDSVHTGNNKDSQKQVVRFFEENDDGLIFANFIDFDMHFGHRRDPRGYGQCLEQTDVYFREFLPRLAEGDVLIITADHGNDPTFKGTDHTREYVPLLVYRPGHEVQNLGIRQGFYDVAQSLASHFGISPMPRGESFL
ncbi:MAG: phosphopentomutase [Verrucomicrobia bacterium]|nr:phosphopentomutase [Verrucomicrobiota bacterium]